MVLESTMICVDDSDYMRNGDFAPTRLQAQQEAVNLVCHSKARANPENNVGLLSLAGKEVLATLTGDVGRVLAKLHRLRPAGEIQLLVGIRIAHLALKHRQGKNHKMRIVVFVGSPISVHVKDLCKLAKRLRKEKVNVDVVSFGEDELNNAALAAFVNVLNSKDGGSGGSHLVSVPSGSRVVLSEALVSSPIVGGEGGASGSGMSHFEFGVDPNEDPELALALRVSMEEQRQRQEEESRRGRTAPDDESGPADRESGAAGRALAVTLGRETMDLSEEEQIALAMQMSMQQETDRVENMDVEYDEVIGDPAFLQSILENLPGVDPQSETIRMAVNTLKNKDAPKDDKEGEDRDPPPSAE